jgi:hypothetical protein
MSDYEIKYKIDSINENIRDINSKISRLDNKKSFFLDIDPILGLIFIFGIFINLNILIYAYKSKNEIKVCPVEQMPK